MTELISFLKDLISAPGLSGYEDPVARIIADKWRPLVHEISRGKVGSLHGLRRGTGPWPLPGTGQEARPSVMVSTHMDAIGLMVTGIQDGFLRVTQVGGVDPRVLPGTPVTVFASRRGATGAGASGQYTTGTGASGTSVSRVTVSGVPGAEAGGTKALPGVVALPSAPLLPEEMRAGPVALKNLFIDTGLLPGEVTELVRVGDVVSFAQPPMEMSGETLSGHSLDNRASVAALTVCLEELQSRPHVWDVWAVASSQEEVGSIGAAGSTFELHPTLALVVDVTFARGPGASDWSTFPLGKGPTIAMGPNMHPALHKAMKELADRLEIPYALEYTPDHSGTDGWATQVAAEGIPTMVVGIPLRYMHTPVEVVALKDIQRAGRLLAEFIAGLGVDFMEKMVWE
jgi:putative aminopeptidase FrvX